MRISAREIAAVGFGLLLSWSVSAQTPTPKPTPTPSPSPSPAPSIVGKWAMTLETEQFTATPGLEFTQKADVLVGTYTSTRYGSVEFKPLVKNRAISFSFHMTAEGTDTEMSFTGEIAADFKSMKGTAEIAGMGSATWSAVRPK
ncbi:MAG TPA: hypothetical protein VFV78_11120 [Vicinamibacterales bacterium]|nr:hypothetical protein [Vicinamibacterales bacterium]